MNLIMGDIWPELDNPETDLFLFPANSMLDARGHLIMGKGLALEAKKKFPHLPSALSIRIKSQGGAGCKFGIISVPAYNHETHGKIVSVTPQVNMFDVIEKVKPPFANRLLRIGAFQTKTDYQNKAELSLIRYSTSMLLEKAGRFKRIVMARPGTGKETGQLPLEKVMPIIKVLPNNVYVYVND